ncbi:hypothetical protein W02_36210 [Nitrospira sp. KM1]|uniref:hypothetical protein n=1 Tax=Nitrospira sp. KM1 TaxID=1936990 RepID=UPI0013A77030|nr:hypothetical protein [Nitrospira sp. KM1]BCA56481.1 hypothetical protein W02_36210 [Nitrospira sp. KM1]
MEHHIAADKILDAVNAHPGCALDELILSMPELTWFEVFHEVDRLGRAGRLKLSQSGLGLTTRLRSQ